MEWFEELIKPVAGSWTSLIIVIVLIAIWAIKTVPALFAVRPGAVKGSPSSARYWRARFAEALAQHDETFHPAERAQLAARVTEARIMVEAHEAKRRVGIGGVVPFWILVVVFALIAAFLLTPAMVLGNPVLLGWAVLFGILMVAAELSALSLSSAGADRFNVFVAAGRFGRSDLVREDPWRVLREYDYARTRAGREERLRARSEQDKSLTTRRVRFERSMLGISAYQNGLGLSPAEIWAPPSRQAPGIHVGDRSEGDEQSPRCNVPRVMWRLPVLGGSRGAHLRRLKAGA